MLDELPEYTPGTTCQLHWELPPDAEPTAYHIQVMPAETGLPDFPDSIDYNYSIFPIPLGDAPGNSYVVGLYPGGAPADDPLSDGVRYCYRIQYRYGVPPDTGFSEWSNVVCSTQDNSAPAVEVTPLPVWVNTATVDIFFHAEDALVGEVDSMKLYYRTAPGSLWVFFAAEDAAGSPVDDEMTFNSASTEGDGYYEFYIAARDVLGNETDPNSGLTPHPMHTWTRFDTEAPEAHVHADELAPFYTSRTVAVPFSATDTYSGVKDVIVYYTRNEGDLTRHDSLFFGGAESVEEVYTFSVDHDGRYGLYFEAVDSAGNREGLEGEEACFYIDTRAPEFTAASAFDTTSSPHRYDVPAEHGYTNSTAVFVFPSGAVDPTVDGYASTIESVYVSESADFEENLQIFEYSESDSYIYVLSAGEGEKRIYVRLKDVAGNFSDAESTALVLDTDAPTMRSVEIIDRTYGATDTTDELDVKLFLDPDPTSSSYCMVFATQDESVLEHIPDDAWADYPANDTLLFSFSGFSDGDWMHVWVVLRDSAGNVSNAAHDSILYHPVSNYMVEITGVRDIDGPDTSGTYTDTTRVEVTITYGSDVDTIELRDDLGGVARYGAPSTAATETTVTYIFDLSAGDGLRTIIAKGKRNDYAFWTAPDTARIILDTHDPYLTSITVEDISTSFDDADTAEVADPGFTNDPLVKVLFNDPYDPETPLGSGIYFLHVECDTEVLEAPFASPVEFELPGEDGTWRVYAAVQDSAGNWSDQTFYDIVLDTHRPTINSVVLRDTSSGDEDYTDEPVVSVFTDADDGARGDPAYIAFFEDPDMWPNNLQDIWQPYGEVLTYEFADDEPGMKILYVAVKDNAGNVSVAACDTILFNPEIRVSISLFDYDRGEAFTEYTNERRVGVKFNPVETTPAMYYLSEDTIPPSPDDFVNVYPSDDIAEYNLSPGEGEKVVYAWLLSVAGTVSPRAVDTIILDMTEPDLPQGFQLWDTTSQDIWYTTFKAHMGWSNELYVYGSVPEASDNLSGVDSLHFLGPFADSLWVSQPFAVVEGGIQVHWPNDSVELILDGTEGSFDITGGAMDGAGNWNNITVHGGYDVTPPQMTILAFEHTDTGSYPATIPMEIIEDHLWKVCYRVVDIDTIVCAVYRAEWGSGPTYEVDFAPAEFLDPHSTYLVEVAAVDSAGNFDLDSMFIGSKLSFKVVDKHDTTDSDYTGCDTVITVIDALHPPDSMRFAENPAALESQPWLPFERTHEFVFSNRTNETKYVYAQVMFGTYVSPVNVDTIILDTIPPTVESISAYDRDTDDPYWSDEQTVKIVINGAADTPPGVVYALRVSESPQFDYNTKILTFEPDNPVVYYTVADEPYVPDEDTGDDLLSVLHAGARRLYAQVLDRAENPSQTKHYDIVVDWEKAEVINFPNPFNPNEGPTHIRVKASTPGAAVEVKIYDMFGNLVWNTSFTLKSGSREGDILWDGRNNDGEIVANGGYVCVVNVGDKTVKRKIAVWKGE